MQRKRRQKAFYIYRITSTVSGKSYIGFTCWKPETRWARHVELSQRGSKTHFHAAIRKYGTEDWIHEVLMVVETADEAKEYERQLIEAHGTRETGYNTTKGGDGSAGHKWTPERHADFKERFKGAGNPFYGKTHDPEVTARIQSRLTELRAEGWCPRTGKTHSAETKKRISEAKTGVLIGPQPQRRLWFVVTDREGKEHLVHGLKEFAEAHNLRSGNLVNCAKGRYKTSLGYQCRYATEEDLKKSNGPLENA